MTLRLQSALVIEVTTGMLMGTTELTDGTSDKGDGQGSHHGEGDSDLHFGC
jgi:hypothetical protein